MEEQLLIADVGVETTRKIITSLTQHASRKQLKDAEALYGKLKEEMSEILAKVDQPLDVSGKTPYVILMVGVNGVGKTTTIGKLARQFQAEGKSVMLAAGILSRRGGRAAAGVGRTQPHPGGGAAYRRGFRFGDLRCGAGCQSARHRCLDRRYRRPSAEQIAPDGRAEEDRPRHEKLDDQAPMRLC